MRRSELALSCAIAWALSCAACSAPATCDAQPYGADERRLVSDERADELLLSEANESQTLHFRATLSGLPELWPSEGGVQGGALSLRLGMSYENEPFGGDGHTEMPQLAVTVSEPAGSASSPTSTPKYPGPLPSSVTAALFADCAFGARQCETLRDIRIRRIDGAPFPPVRVSWRATADATIGVCRALSPAPELTL